MSRTFRIELAGVALFLGLALVSGVEAQEYSAQYTWLTRPPSQGYTPGADVKIVVQVKNTGRLAWNPVPDAQGRHFVLGYHWKGPVVLHAGADGPLGTLPKTVPPGGTVDVPVSLPVPQTAGTYILQWDMAHLGATWFTGCCGVTGASPPAPNPGAARTVGVGAPPASVVQADAPFLLCQLVDCDMPKAFCADGPTITGWVPFSGMRQGGVVALGGSCFGQPGTLRLRGLPGGDVALGVVEWKHKAVAASIPTTLAVPTDTPVTVEVTRADGKKAISPPITFIPIRELKKVPRSAVSVDVCGGALTDCNHCNDTTVHIETSSLNFCQFVVASDATVRGEHIGDCIFGCNHPGTDRYLITLKNHHRFHSATWSKDVSATGEANANGSQATSAHVQGKAAVTINVPFWVTGWDWVRYEINLYVEGPVNVPGW